MGAFISSGRPKFSEAKLPPQHEVPPVDYAIIEQVNSLHEAVVGDYMRRRSRGFIGHVLLSAQGVSSPWHQQNIYTEHAVDVFTPIALDRSGGGPGGSFKSGLGGAFKVDSNASFQFWPDANIDLTIGRMAQDERTGKVTIVDSNPVNIELELPAHDSEEGLRHSFYASYKPYFMKISGLPAHDALHIYESLHAYDKRGMELIFKTARVTHNIVKEKAMSVKDARAQAVELFREEEVVLRTDRCYKKAKALNVELTEGLSLGQKEEQVEAAVEAFREQVEAENEQVLVLLKQITTSAQR